MNGLSIVQACLALCFYKKLPENLINRVFNIEFIKRLEDEIEMCYSKVQNKCVFIKKNCLQTKSMTHVGNVSGTCAKSGDAIKSSRLLGFSGCQRSLVSTELHRSSNDKM